MKPLDVDMIKELYIDEKKSLTEIGQLLKVSPVTVRDRLKKQGVTLRSCNIKGRYWSEKKRGPEYTGADGYVYLRGFPKKRKRSIHVMEEIIKGTIPKGFHVHHINGDKTKDDPENLCLLPHWYHCFIHHKGIKNPNKTVNKYKQSIKQKEALCGL